MAHSENKLLTPKEVSHMLGVSVETLNVWRATNRYQLPYVKMGSLVRYTQAAIEEFIESRTQYCHAAQG